ncbi:hypothetical protein [Nocardia xishanensis]|uniref:Uncharacterized protein n=1 Tax=Nocardia xishanensis TaxID=238964 RepID=A0ABW7XAI3_9NOCA
MPGEVGADLVDAELPELLYQVGSGSDFAVGQFGVAMQVVPVPDQFGFEIPQGLVDSISERGGRHR